MVLPAGRLATAFLFVCSESHCDRSSHSTAHMLSPCLLYYVGSCDYTQVEKCKTRPLLPALLYLLLTTSLHFTKYTTIYLLRHLVQPHQTNLQHPCCYTDTAVTGGAHNINIILKVIIARHAHARNAELNFCGIVFHI